MSSDSVFLSQSHLYSITIYHWICQLMQPCSHKTACIQSLGVCRKAQVFYYLVSDAKIFDMIYQLSPLLECDPTVCLSPLEKLGNPRASPRMTLFFSVRQTVGSHFNKGDNCIWYKSDKNLWIKYTKGP